LARAAGWAETHRGADPTQPTTDDVAQRCHPFLGRGRQPERRTFHHYPGQTPTFWAWLSALDATQKHSAIQKSDLLRETLRVLDRPGRAQTVASGQRPQPRRLRLPSAEQQVDLAQVGGGKPHSLLDRHFRVTRDLPPAPRPCEPWSGGPSLGRPVVSRSTLDKDPGPRVPRRA
jgi:hypothetical protein